MIAPIAVKIVFVKILFFVALEERPTEVPARAYKKWILQKRLKRKAGNSSKKLLKFPSL